MKNCFMTVKGKKRQETRKYFEQIMLQPANWSLARIRLIFRQRVSLGPKLVRLEQSLVTAEDTG